MIKKLIPIVIIILLLPILAYSAIVITNNVIADRVEKALASHALPEGTTLLDSLSAAGRFEGNGNGMQYMGAILVESESSSEELKKHYGTEFDFIEVRRQETAELNFTHDSFSFDGFSEVTDKSYFAVICQESDRRELFGDFLCALLDLDVRGH